MATNTTRYLTFVCSPPFQWHLLVAAPDALIVGQVDFHATNFSTATAAAALKQRQLHLAATDDHLLTSGRGVFCLFLTRRSPVLKACTLIERISHFQFLPDIHLSFLISLLTPPRS
jgi:hypothetical protein